MLLAVHGSLGTLHIEARLPSAGAEQATLVADVHHSVFSMLFAVYRFLASLHINVGMYRAGVVRTTIASDTNHTVFSMPLAEQWRLHTLHIKARLPRAGDMCTVLYANVNHAVLGMGFAVRRRLAGGLCVEGRSRLALMVPATRHSSRRVEGRQLPFNPIENVNTGGSCWTDVSTPAFAAPAFTLNFTVSFEYICVMVLLPRIHHDHTVTAKTRHIACVYRNKCNLRKRHRDSRRTTTTVYVRRERQVSIEVRGIVFVHGPHCPFLFETEYRDIAMKMFVLC